MNVKKYTWTLIILSIALCVYGLGAILSVKIDFPSSVKLLGNIVLIVPIFFLGYLLVLAMSDLDDGTKKTLYLPQFFIAFCVFGLFYFGVIFPALQSVLPLGIML